MGLIKALTGAAGGVLADQWKEYFICNALEEDVIVEKGQKKVSGRSSNTKGVDNIITTGSVVVVNEGQCMLIVDQGKVAEVCAEPGEYTYTLIDGAGLVTKVTIVYVANTNYNVPNKDINLTEDVTLVNAPFYNIKENEDYFVRSYAIYKDILGKEHILYGEIKNIKIINE